MSGASSTRQCESYGARGATPPANPWTKEIVIYLVTVLLLLWPLVINGAPFYSADSASYLRGGRFGFDTGLLMLSHWWHELGPSAATLVADPKVIVANAVAQAGGMRSIIYSLATYLLRAPGDSLIALAVAQAATVAFVVCCLRRLIVPRCGLAAGIALGAAVASLTSAGWYAAYAVPDIFAGTAICAAVALTVFYERTSVALRVVLVAILAFCITVHGSHLPLAFCVLCAGAVANFLRRQRPRKFELGQAFWFASPVLLAVAALLSTSYIAFGEASLAPKRYPIQLARSVADGPGAWYLREHCATERYAICEIFGADPPRKVGDFLWGRNGVRYRATPEQMDRIRAEESTIVRRAALEYPVAQLRRSAANAFLQLFEFGPRDLVFGERMAGGEDPMVVQVYSDERGLKKVGTVLIYMTFVASIVLLVAFRRRLTRAEVGALSVVATGVVVNAAVCGILSGVTDRYQGRVAWVLPALAFAILLRVKAGSSVNETTAKVMLA